MQCCGHFFVNQNGKALSDQSVRRMINKYTALASIDLHITPHMFRHTFATCLLEADVDIRYIQGNAGAQFDQYHGDLYACRDVEAEGYIDCQASAEGFSYISFGPEIRGRASI